MSRKPNRLAAERSPYLLQHALNPVDWHPWGDEAFEKARREQKPVFLSVGYSTCHWCHVMEHESFEDDEVARVLNEGFVPVKVDREERPDVDDVYMRVTQLLTEHGGWPMSVFLTPEKRPFFAGTYFPKRGGRGLPGFLDLLHEIGEAWRTRREKVEESAAKVAEAAAGASHAGALVDRVGPGGLAGPDVLAIRVARDTARRFDQDHGGFGHAPKFPPHHMLRLLVEEREHLGPDAFGMATATLDAMAAGGIYDHLGGGFARYSTDDRWLVPHFEKMLYDNAMLARTYAVAHEALGGESEDARAYEATARGTLDFVLREMTSAEGAFLSALDADSEGVEGKFYVWTPDQVRAALGDEAAADAKLFCDIYDVQPGGNFEHGSSIPNLPRPISVWARLDGIPATELEARLAPIRARLFEARAARVRPGLDDKVIVAWNGLAIGAFATAARILGEPRYLEAARRAATFLIERLRRPDGRLASSFRGEPASTPFFLDDVAFLADGLLDLHGVDEGGRWLGEARGLAERLLADFHDPADGGFFATGPAHETLLFRSKDAFDGAMPSGNGVAARVLVRLAAATGEPSFAEHARRAAEAWRGLLAAAPSAAPTLVQAYLQWGYLSGSVARRSGPSTDPAASVVATSASTSTSTSTSTGIEPVRAEAWPLVVEARAVPDAGEIHVRVALAPGFHIYANDPGPGGKNAAPTTLAVETGDLPVEAGPPSFPAGELAPAGVSPEPLKVYRGATEIRVPLTVRAGSAPATGTVRVRLRSQPCDDRRCLAPVDIAVEVPLSIG